MGQHHAKGTALLILILACQSARALAQDAVDGTNSPPTMPSIVSPDAVTVATLRPTLVADNAIDPDGDALSYAFEVSTTPDFLSLVSRGAVYESPSGRTSWTVSVDLMDGLRYHWRTWANDGQDDGPEDTSWFDVDLSHSEGVEPERDASADASPDPDMGEDPALDEGTDSPLDPGIDPGMDPDMEVVEDAPLDPEPPPESGSQGSGCGCRTVPGQPSWPMTALAAAMLCLAARRRTWRDR